MYDKQKRVLRIECTTNDVTFYRQHRKVAQRVGGYRYQLAALKRSIYSLGDLRELLAAAARCLWSSWVNWRIAFRAPN